MYIIAGKQAEAVEYIVENKLLDAVIISDMQNILGRDFRNKEVILIGTFAARDNIAPMVEEIMARGGKIKYA